MKVKTVVCSSVGMKRKVNQDNFYVNGKINRGFKKYILKSFFRTKKEQILCVCDGMGGEKNGEIASLIAVKCLKKYKKRYSNLFSRFEEHAVSYVQSANNMICTYIKESNERMGSTVVCACISEEEKEAVVSNLGDSKAFLYRNMELKKLTQDHNQAQSLVHLGIISDEEARTHKDKSKLTQHLGIFRSELVIEPYVSDNVMLEKGDIIMLCSDGLTDMLSYDEIANILNEKKKIKKKCKKLTDTANANGGTDNITVILAEVV